MLLLTSALFLLHFSCIYSVVSSQDVHNVKKKVLTTDLNVTLPSQNETQVDDQPTVIFSTNKTVTTLNGSELLPDGKLVDSNITPSHNEDFTNNGTKVPSTNLTSQSSISKKKLIVPESSGISSSVPSQIPRPIYDPQSVTQKTNSESSSVHARKGVDASMEVLTNTSETEIVSTSTISILVESTEQILSIFSAVTHLAVSSSTKTPPTSSSVIPSVSTSILSTNITSSTSSFSKQSSLKPTSVGPSTTHSKPNTSGDIASPSDELSTASYTSVIVGIVLLLSLLATVLCLVYRRMRHVWSRRHYDRMDFLVDGMYDV